MCIRDRLKGLEGLEGLDFAFKWPWLFFEYQFPAARRNDSCLLYTSDAADERYSVDLGGRSFIKKKKKEETTLNREITIQVNVK